MGIKGLLPSEAIRFKEPETSCANNVQSVTYCRQTRESFWFGFCCKSKHAKPPT
jgi:hypothetical protein